MVEKTNAGFGLTTTFVHLTRDGGAERIECTPAFWSESGAGKRRYDRLVGVFHFEHPKDLHPDMWEMHPAVDEVLYLVSGSLDVVLQQPKGEQIIALESGHALVVPRGVWHRLVMRTPGDLLFINNRTDIQGRRVDDEGVGT